MPTGIFRLMRHLFCSSIFENRKDVYKEMRVKALVIPKWMYCLFDIPQWSFTSFENRRTLTFGAWLKVFECFLRSIFIFSVPQEVG